MQKHSIRKILKASGAVLAGLLVLTLSAPALAQTPAPSESEPPPWFKDIPAYSNVQKLEVDDNTLSSIGISRAQFYISAGASADSVTTIADFYVSKLEAAGWKVERQPIGPPNLAQQLTFTNPQDAAKQLVVLVASQQALTFTPQFKALAALIPEKQTLVALAAPLANAQPQARPGSSTGSSQPVPEELIEPPAWFKTVPVYNGAQKLELDDAMFNGLGVNRSEYYAIASITPDSVAKVIEFYNNNLKSRGWSSPVKTPLPKDELGQILLYRGGNFILVVVSKEGLDSVPTLKAASEKVPPGQTLVLMATPSDGPPVKGTRCVAGQECVVGPYRMKVSFDRTSFNTTDPVMATVERLDKPGSAWELGAEVVPSNSTEASTVQFRGDFEKGTAPTRKVKLEFPVAGSWFTYLTIKGEEGESKLYIAGKVEPPPLMDEWVAWTLGLTPLAGIVGFAFGQWRLVARHKREEEAEATQTAPADDKELAARH